MAKTGKITIWSEPEDRSAAFPIPGRRAVSLNELETQALATNLKMFLEEFDGVVETTPSAVGGYSVSEITLHLGVSAEGEVGFIAKVGIGLEAGISVTLKKS